MVYPKGKPFPPESAARRAEKNRGKRRTSEQRENIGRGVAASPKPPMPRKQSQYYTIFRGEHRLIATLALGRLLTDREDVHHIDGDHGNNRPENLEVLTSSEHSSQHLSSAYAALRLVKEAT